MTVATVELPEQFDESARDVVSRCIEETEALHLSCVPSVNLLIAILLQNGNEERFLSDHGITIQKVRAKRDRYFQRKPVRPKQISFAPITLEAFQLAVSEARSEMTDDDKDVVVTPRHLLLGLLRKQGGAVIHILNEFDTPPRALYSQLRMQAAA